MADHSVTPGPPWQGPAPSGDDKLEYRKIVECVKYATSSLDWEPCLTECTRITDAAIHAALETSAKITIHVRKYGNGYEDQRCGETYLTVLNGYAISTQG